MFFGLAGDGLEVVLVVIDGFLFEDAHAGRVPKELAYDLALGGDGLAGRGRRGFVSGFGTVRCFGRRSRLLSLEGRGGLNFFLDDLLFLLDGSEAELAAGRFHAMGGGRFLGLVLVLFFDGLDAEFLSGDIFDVVLG
jgi:hypothetical protein